MKTVRCELRCRAQLEELQKPTIVCIKVSKGREGKTFLNNQISDEGRRQGVFSPGPVAIGSINFLVLEAVSQSQAPCASV